MRRSIDRIRREVVRTHWRRFDVLTALGYVPTKYLKKNQNTPRPSEDPPAMGKNNVKTFRWDQRLQIQNLFMAFKQVPRCR